MQHFSASKYFNFNVIGKMVFNCSAEWLKKEAEKMKARRDEAEVEEQKMVEEVNIKIFIIQI